MFALMYFDQKAPSPFFSFSTMTAGGAFSRTRPDAQRYFVWQFLGDWKIGAPNRSEHTANNQRTTSMDESECDTLKHMRELERWTFAWYDEAVKAGAIGAAYSPDTATINRLRGYFRAGLSPTEAALACFGSRH
jgi:hypothetical protein